MGEHDFIKVEPEGQSLVEPDHILEKRKILGILERTELMLRILEEIC